MAPPSEPPRDGGAGAMTAAYAEALDVVEDALLWRLTEARWQAIEDVLTAMEAAAAAGDPAALTSATADLELAGPLRLTRIGATPAVPAAAAVHDQLIRLRYSLGGVSVAEQDQADDAGADDGRASGR